VNSQSKIEYYDILLFCLSCEHVTPSRDYAVCAQKTLENPKCDDVVSGQQQDITSSHPSKHTRIKDHISQTKKYQLSQGGSTSPKPNSTPPRLSPGYQIPHHHHSIHLLLPSFLNNRNLLVLHLHKLVIRLHNCLRVNMHLRRSAAVPRRQQNTTAPTLVLHVLERVHKIGNAAQAEETAETGGPCTVLQLAIIFD
jgi:hypothetical protein